MNGVVGRLQMRILKSVLVTFCLSVQALAGHDVMVHLAIYNDGPFNVEKVPAVFGVPFPSSDDPVDLKDLVLAGADTFQMRPLSHWPNGSVRWLMVEAIVNVQPHADRAVVHLTTGQRPPKKPDIAKEISNGYLMDTGLCTLRVEEGEKILCKLEQVEGEKLPDFSIQLSSENEKLGPPKSRQVVLENNGPVTATVAVIEQYELEGVPLEFSRRCRVFKGQKGMEIVSTLRRLYTYPDLSAINNVYPNLTLAKSTQLKTNIDSSWNINSLSGVEKGTLDYVSGGRDIQIRTSMVMNDEVSETSITPNWLARIWHEVDLNPNENDPGTFSPFIGIAISPHTYNDSHCLEAYVRKGTSNSRIKLTSERVSSFEVSNYLYELMGGELFSTPLVIKSMNQWISRLAGAQYLVSIAENQIQKNNIKLGVLGLYSNWYFLTGDVVLRDTRIDLASYIGKLALGVGHDRVLKLWDAYLLNSSVDYRDDILSNLSEYFIKDRFVPEGMSTSRLLANIIYQGGFKGGEHGKWLDRFECLIHKNRNWGLNDAIQFAEGYRLTGENLFLSEGRQWLKSSPTTHPANNAITGMIENIQRQYTWRWLPVNIKDLGEQGWELSWTTPKNVVRYRLKQSDKPITNIPQPNGELTTTSFCSADDLELDIPPLNPGSHHSFLVSKSVAKNYRFFAMRYLERGQDLPVPKSALQTGSGVTSDRPTPQSLATTLIKYFMMALVFLVVFVVFIVFIKKFI